MFLCSYVLPLNGFLKAWDRSTVFTLHYFAEELIDIFYMLSLEEGVLGASNWTDVFDSSAELDVLDYYEDFEVSRVLYVVPGFC